MQNPSFEDGWDDIPAGVTINQEPTGWQLHWAQAGEPLHARPELRGAGDTEDYVHRVPECVHKLSWQLPPDEQLGGDDALILDGDTTYKVFAAQAFRATLAQSFDVAKDATCRITVPVQTHGQLQEDGTPYNVDKGAAYWRVTVNGKSSDWLTFVSNFDDRAWASYSTIFTADTGVVDVFIEFESHTVAGIDFFIDDVKFSTEGGDPISECRGKPRVQYERVYNLLPQNATIEQEKHVVDIVHGTKETIGYSADDAGIGDLDFKHVCIWWFSNDSWDENEINKFFFTFYPNTSFNHCYDYDPDPEPPPIDPPPGGEPGHIAHYSGNFVGWQHAFAAPGWDDYLRDAQPTVVKCFQLGDVVEAKRINPNALVIWREFVDNYDTGNMINDGMAGAIRYVDLYYGKLEAHSNSTGIPISELVSGIVIESLNETIPSNNATVINLGVTFDVNFSKALHDKLGYDVKAGLLNVAIGNPFESEVVLLLPCAKLSHEIGDMLGYHGYWSADESQDYLDEHYQWHSGRWEEWDKVFNEYGYYPTYYLGECGIVYTSPESNGTNFMPTQGWKSCGSFESYIQQTIEFNAYITRWNSDHQGRCFGGTLFIYGAWNWEDFEPTEGDLAEHAEAMKVYV